MSRIPSIPLSIAPEIKVGLLTGGGDRHYAFGLVMALIAKGVRMDVIGGDLVDSPEMHSTAGLRYFNLHGSNRTVSFVRKVKRILVIYARLLRYAVFAEPRVFHILWNNKLQFFDRTLLMLYYKLLGKRIVLTAHNVNAGRRDLKDSILNRLTLEFQYRVADHIFVHTKKMKEELKNTYHVDETAVTIIPYGINNAVPQTDLTPMEARQRLGIRVGERVILFFGTIRPYKGLEYLVAAFQQLSTEQDNWRLIIAGSRTKGHETYLKDILLTVSSGCNCEHVIQKIDRIPDDEIEMYFKAADTAVLPYTEIFQSGIAFLAYSFGLPLIATDVGSFREDIIEGRTGFICKPKDATDLAVTIRRYFDSDLYKELDHRRQEVRDYMLSEHSWEVVSEMTRNVYLRLLEVSG
jgi:glycosyltransferase involved in cell wall biosynthesis